MNHDAKIHFDTHMVKALIVFISAPLLLFGCMTRTSQSDRSGRANSQSTGNMAHDQLIALGPNEQAVALGKVVDAGCIGEYAFFMGLDKDTKNAYWSVRCANAKSYEVQISSDATGSTRVLECDVLKAFTKIRCFEKLDQQ